MDTVTIAHAKEHLEDLIERARRGEDVTIVDDRLGTVRLTPVAEQQPSEPPYPRRRLGLIGQMVEIPEDRLLAPLTEDELSWLSGETSEVER